MTFFVNIKFVCITEKIILCMILILTQIPWGTGLPISREKSDIHFRKKNVAGSFTCGVELAVNGIINGPD